MDIGRRREGKRKAGRLEEEVRIKDGGRKVKGNQHEGSRK